MKDRNLLAYYLENYLPGDSTAPDYVSEICIPVKSIG